MIEFSFINEAFEKYNNLKCSQNKFDKQLFNAIQREIDYLKNNPQRGIHILRKYVPKKTVEKFKTNKLWKINLPDYWRMIYTLYAEDNKVIIIILEIVNHKDYNKIFGYKKK